MEEDPGILKEVLLKRSHRLHSIMLYFIVTPEITKCVEPWSFCCLSPLREVTRPKGASSRLPTPRFPSDKNKPTISKAYQGGHEPCTCSRPQASRSRDTTGGILERRVKEPSVETSLAPATLPRLGSNSSCPGPFTLESFRFNPAFLPVIV